MCNRNSLSRVNKGLFCIMQTIPVVASFLGIPENLESRAGETEELYFPQCLGVRPLQGWLSQ